MDLEVLREDLVVACLDFQEGGQMVGRRVGHLEDQTEGRWADQMGVHLEDRMVALKVGHLEDQTVGQTGDHLEGRTEGH